MRRVSTVLCLAACLAAPSFAEGAMRGIVEADWALDAQPAAGAVTTRDDAAGGNDGILNGGYGFHCASGAANSWWQVDLQETVALDRVVVYNRCGGSESRAAKALVLLASSDGKTWAEAYKHDGTLFRGYPDGKPLVVSFRERDVRARFVRLQERAAVSFHLDEVQVYPKDAPEKNIALGKPADQSSVGQWSTSKGKAAPAGRPPLDLAARWAAREAFLANPLLDFDRLVFVKRHPGTYGHMCDQYYGSLQKPGGGLFVLESLRGDAAARNLLGGQLPPGNFLSPDLSYDGQRIVFAYTRCAGKPHTWTPEACFHLFVVNVDGTGLRQLTDGPYDDIHPRFLPDGGIAFISTRRGGYCRCGARPVPTYTLHRIDGGEIRRLSHHETNEWHPCVANDGRLLYSRWDYVDRHTNLAHSLWTCQADGSNAVAFYGNYNFAKKPWGLWHPMAVPGSRKVVAVAGAHHGWAKGSLVLIDPAAGRDGLDPIERLTPEVPFPEAEGWPTRCYTTPYPLSEDLFLVSYSPRWSAKKAEPDVAAGLYVQDRRGRRELLYRDPALSSLSPTPLRPRPRPVVRPLEAAAGQATGRFLVLNLYDSTEPIPQGTIKTLRIVEILPKTTFVNDRPKISVARQVSARYLLGTVPVEEDGSAQFTAPAGVPLYFQAVDAEGMAVQSMRSIAYVQPGETLSCVGCHEPRHTAPPNHVPLAAMRPPSAIEPGPDGSKPFSYPRLVQPVLDRHCVRCHGDKRADGGVRLTGRLVGPHSESYRALATKKLVHWFDSVNGGEWVPRTYPGKFGARASRLVALLREGHYDVKLAPDELRRITLWIDLNVPFYGVYEPDQVAEQLKGGVVPLAAIAR